MDASKTTKTETQKTEEKIESRRWVQIELEAGEVLNIPYMARQFSIHLEPEELEPLKPLAIKKIGGILSRNMSLYPSDWISALKRAVEMFGIEPDEFGPYKQDAIRLTGQLFSGTRAPGDMDVIDKKLEDAVEMFGIKPEDRQPLKYEALKWIDELKKLGFISNFISQIVNIAGILDIKPNELGPYKREAITKVGVGLLPIVGDQGILDVISDYIKTFDIKPNESGPYRSEALEEIGQLIGRKRVIDALRIAKMFGIAEIEEELIEKLSKTLKLMRQEPE